MLSIITDFIALDFLIVLIALMVSVLVIVGRRSPEAGGKTKHTIEGPPTPPWEPVKASLVSNPDANRFLDTTARIEEYVFEVRLGQKPQMRSFKSVNARDRELSCHWEPTQQQSDNEIKYTDRPLFGWRDNSRLNGPLLKQVKAQSADLYFDPGAIQDLADDISLPKVIRGRLSFNGFPECDLRLMSVDTADGLVNEGRNLVVVALVGTDLHIRIFDANGKRVVDKAENELISGETLTALKKQLNPIPDESRLSAEQKQKFIRDATSIAGHTRFPLQGMMASASTPTRDDGKRKHPGDTGPVEYLTEIRVYPAPAEPPTLTLNYKSAHRFPDLQPGGTLYEVMAIEIETGRKPPLRSDFDGMLSIQVQRCGTPVPAQHILLARKERKDGTAELVPRAPGNEAASASLSLRMGECLNCAVKLCLGTAETPSPVGEDEYQIRVTINSNTAEKADAQGSNGAPTVEESCTVTFQPNDDAKAALYLVHRPTRTPVGPMLFLDKLFAGQEELKIPWETSLEELAVGPQEKELLKTLELAIELPCIHDDDPPINVTGTWKVKTRGSEYFTVELKAQPQAAVLDASHRLAKLPCQLVFQPQHGAFAPGALSELLDTELAVDLTRKGSTRRILVQAQFLLVPQPSAAKLCIDFGTSAVTVAISAGSESGLVDLGSILSRHDPGHDEANSQFIASYVGVTAEAARSMRTTFSHTPQLKHWPTAWLIEPTERLKDLGLRYHIALPFAPAYKLCDSTAKVVYGLKSRLGSGAQSFTLADSVRIPQCVNGTIGESGEIIIQELIADALFDIGDFYLNEEQRRAVAHGKLILTVPNTFGPLQYRTLKQAAEKLCHRLKIDTAKVTLVSESDAAALYFLLNRQRFKRKLKQTVLVYDFGAGTLDISVIDMQWRADSSVKIPERWTVRQRLGVPRGGNALDELIAYIVDQRLRDLLDMPDHGQYEYIHRLVGEKLPTEVGRFNAAVAAFRAALLEAKKQLSEAARGPKTQRYGWPADELFQIRVGSIGADNLLVKYKGSKPPEPRERYGARLHVKKVQSQQRDEEAIFLELKRRSFDCPAMSELINFLCQRTIEVTLNGLEQEGITLDAVIISGRAALWPPIIEGIRGTLNKLGTPESVLEPYPPQSDELKQAVVVGAMHWADIDKNAVKFEPKTKPSLALVKGPAGAQGIQQIVFERDWNKGIDLSDAETVRFMIAPDGVTEDDFNHSRFGNLFFIDMGWTESRDRLGYRLSRPKIKIRQANSDELAIINHDGEHLPSDPKFIAHPVEPPWPISSMTLATGNYSAGELRPPPLAEHKESY